MKPRSGLFIPEQVMVARHDHKKDLSDTLTDFEQCSFTLLDLEKLSKQDRRLLDRFAYRYACPQANCLAKHDATTQYMFNTAADCHLTIDTLRGGRKPLPRLPGLLRQVMP
ncbi:hypothetical protein [Nitrosomonas sp. Nm58]|uniref:hypothetical protein n=1 Tax=Nitrosomonas sp. Nm58 TaxID=200126 RepID=UPI00089D41B1|nr:hypothetical protein [Nitrosomonas sp. Nm58]SDY64022.1 hypothetical protein SAMN05421754_101617 [Nitrosomonas sp. Nm58]